MSQGPLCPNLTQKVQKEVSQIANRNLPHAMLLGGLSVNLNHLKSTEEKVRKKHLTTRTVNNVSHQWLEKLEKRHVQVRFYLSQYFLAQNHYN